MPRFKKDIHKISQDLIIAKEEKSRLQQEIVRLREEKATEIAILQGNLDNILASRSWRFIQIVQKIRLVFVPLGSTREKSIKVTINFLSFEYMAKVVSVLRSQGIVGLFIHIRNRIKKLDG